MICKDLNIPNCPQCKSNRDDLCWILVYKEIFKSITKEEIKHLFLNSYQYSAYYPDHSLKCSDYIYAAVKLYLPQYKEYLDKLRVLL